MLEAHKQTICFVVLTLLRGTMLSSFLKTAEKIVGEDMLRAFLSYLDFRGEFVSEVDGKTLWIAIRYF